jgi:hypothetical protein
MTARAVAWLARGQLHLRAPDGAVRALESRFGETVAGRALQIEQKHAWKTQGRGAQFMSGGLLWGTRPDQGAAMPYVITSLTRGRAPGELLYSLETREIAGVFAVRDGGADEQRLFHGNDRRVRHLSADATRGLIACSLGKPTGVACLAVMPSDSLDLSEVTEGDVLDAAPSWVPGPGRRLVYHSSGIARDKAGFVTGIGPAAVRQVDLDRGEVETLAEDPRHDLLAPRRAASGDLYFLRRPWRGTDRPTVWGATRDFLLFPARLLFAFFQWLNFFSVRYSGKPLTTAGGPRKEGADIRQMMIWGNLVDAEQAAREGADKGDDPPDLVPPSWQLVRRSPAGEEAVLARGVVAFDLADDGALVYTNGAAIWALGADGTKERLCVDRQVEQVVAV